jgi:hypothetical protein
MIDQRPEVLLGPAALLLQSHGFLTATIPLSAATTLLLAENDYFAIGIAEFAGPADLVSTESSSAAEIVERVSRDAGAKRWDAYLVLLSTTAQVGEDLLPEEVATIVYDTRYLRRIVRWNVAPDQDALTQALRAFIPLPAPQSGAPTSPLGRLGKSLVTYGIPEAEASDAIARWRATGQRDG